MSLNNDKLLHGHHCSHYGWWHGTFTAARRPFAGAGTPRRYAPSLTVQTKHVKLVLNVDPEGKTLAGTCDTTFEPIFGSITEVFFEAAPSIKVEKVTVSGSTDPLAFTTSPKGMTVQLPKSLSKGESIEISVQYHLEDPKAGIYFTGPSSQYSGKPFQTWTQGEDQDSHHWFPVINADHPNHKMTSEVIVTVPSKYTALSNGRLLEDTVDQAKGTRTTHWLLNRPHSAYLITLTVGVFVKLEKTWRGMPVQLFCDASLEAQAKEYFEGTDQLIELFSQLSGVDYPWAVRYAQVMVQDYMFGGMENTTNTTMTDTILADHSTRAEYRKSEIRLNAHELKHDWDGDLITCEDWAHVYIQEGGATYGEVEAMEHFYGVPERDYYVQGLAEIYFAEDREYRRPLVTNQYSDPMDMFDRHTYQKGGLVRHMLRYLLGDRGYYDSVKTFYTDNAFQSVTTHDWIKAIKKATGQNLQQFFDQWVFGAGFPEYAVTYTWDKTKKVATVKVSQTQTLDDTTGLFTMPIVFSFGFADGTSQDFTNTVAGKDGSFDFPLNEKPAVFRFDPNNWVLKKVSLHGLSKRMLMRQLRSDSSVMSRITAARALAKMRGVDVVSALEKACHAKFHWGVGVEAANCLGTMKTVAAMKALRRLVRQPDAVVRRSVVHNLSHFTHESVVDLLVGIVSGGKEKSLFVIAEAAQSLGKTKSTKAFGPLQNALNRQSWNDMVKIAALLGLAELDDERVIDLLVAHAAPGQSMQARPVAIHALGKVTATRPKALAKLHALANQTENEFRLRMALIGALGETKQRKSLPILKQLAHTAQDGRLCRAARLAIDDLEAPKDDNSILLGELRQQMAVVSGELAQLDKRIRKSKKSA
jgi:aminopeptidase N